MESTNQGSFDCCHLWYKCSFGKNGCEWGKTRPEKPLACNCYKRHNKSRIEPLDNKKQITNKLTVKKTDIQLQVESESFNSELQLTLF
ncbi:hypothetical protein FC676_11475 [Bacillus cereus]|uniref:hypothetical protein n=1 Tax=Bacillus cereus TaxID=1396 RepID=UPI0010BE800B|nr:hypothetical protein [Bacillus cereus]TKH73426.1 hypothetical protein FC676_11475 [Bacillus cereus]